MLGISLLSRTRFCSSRGPRYSVSQPHSQTGSRADKASLEVKKDEQKNPTLNSKQGARRTTMRRSDGVLASSTVIPGELCRVIKLRRKGVEGMRLGTLNGTALGARRPRSLVPEGLGILLIVESQFCWEGHQHKVQCPPFAVAGPAAGGQGSCKRPAENRGPDKPSLAQLDPDLVPVVGTDPARSSAVS